MMSSNVERVEERVQILLQLIDCRCREVRHKVGDLTVVGGSVVFSGNSAPEIILDDDEPSGCDGTWKYLDVKLADPRRTGAAGQDGEGD